VPANVELFEALARLYPPVNSKDAYLASEANDHDVAPGDPGLAGGHIDVDTSHALYHTGSGTTDAHVHAYDDKYNVSSVDMMQFLGTGLEDIQSIIPKGVAFKLIISNGNLSTGGKVSINQSYDSGDAGSYVKVTDYQNQRIGDLPVFSMDGAPGTTKLTSLSMNFSRDAITSGGLVGTVTGAVRSNEAGARGEYRDGALTIQAVRVNPDGSPAFTTNTALSNGGVQGVATSGLLWECTMFWHWKGGAY
jgi:hypothetical protein